MIPGIRREIASAQTFLEDNWAARTKTGRLKNMALAKERC